MAARRAYEEPHNLGRMDVVCIHCGALHWRDEATGKPKDGFPAFGSCCNHGKVALLELPEPPPQLKQLLVAADTQATEFHSHITQYNAALAFTSLGVNNDKAINQQGQSGWVFQIQGYLYHLSGALTAPEGRAPSYSQLYIFDPAIAFRQRMHRNSDLRGDTMQTLQDMLLQLHPYTAKYRQAYEILADQDAEIQDVAVHLRVMSGQDKHRYNLPTADKVAFVLPGNGEGGLDGCPRVPEGWAPLSRISDRHPTYATLYYVLLFPRGEHGWYEDLRLNDPSRANPGRLTQSRYYAYRIFPRATKF
ncbi:hypothetical protein DFH07DRAFT_728173 [Mycena maculata]|uniref:Helitron helicase-like domain-containing protein n=1 Tax=Mycena maculata TaxID=230809 RepID=A0AAD7KBK3_9AGAR|nr:hypothetical protein DFH07DRAFT_728173 [Mycena maculata]